MLNKAFNRHMEEGRLIRLVLVFALVIGAAHVAGHDQDVNGGSLVWKRPMPGLSSQPHAGGFIGPTFPLCPVAASRACLSC